MTEILLDILFTDDNFCLTLCSRMREILFDILFTDERFTDDRNSA